jgi:hypothetical protein
MGLEGPLGFAAWKLEPSWHSHIGLGGPLGMHCYIHGTWRPSWLRHMGLGETLCFAIWDSEALLASPHWGHSEHYHMGIGDPLASH